MAEETVILDAIRRRNPPNTEFRISRTIPGFLDGELVVIELSRDTQNLGENFYYAARYPPDNRSFTSMDELALWIGQRQGDTPRIGRLSFLTDFRVVSALIAIVILFTICVIILSGLFSYGGDRKIPDILSNALTTILGFYFGSQVARSRGADSERESAPTP